VLVVADRGGNPGHRRIFQIDVIAGVQVVPVVGPDEVEVVIDAGDEVAVVVRAVRVLQWIGAQR
jgi:hypothetical protein